MHITATKSKSKIIVCRQDEIRRVVPVAVGLADTDFHPGELVGVQLINNALDAVVSTGGAAFSHPEAACGQIQVVKDYDDALGRHLVGACQVAHRFAGQVHIGLGLYQHQGFAGIISAGDQRFALGGANGAGAQTLCQQVKGKEPGIMPGCLVLSAGVAQADD